ncbi:MAG: prolipoprotein diacylglyceryl transferase [Bacilli bacterium]|jgi:phosphatidylglycerol:prolipoprotein diacylglycerol transferase
MNQHDMIIDKIDPVAFSIFGAEIYWYAIFIMTGALTALVFSLYVGKKIGISQNDIIDGFIMGLIIGIIGARLFYVLFTLGKGLYHSLWDIINIRDGGLAIYGGVIFGTVFAILFCRKRKINLYKVMELLAPGFMIGQIFGRWGNFFNKEATGGLVKFTIDVNETLTVAQLDEQRSFLKSLLLPDGIVNRMYFDAASTTNTNPWVGYYHPTFLYESLWNFLGLVTVLLIRKFVKKFYFGDAMLFYLAWYGLGRFFIEGMRTDSLMFLGMRVSQLISLILFVAGITLFILRRVFKIELISVKEAIDEYNEKQKQEKLGAA